MWRIYNPKFTHIHLAISQLWPYKVLPSMKKFGAHSSFSSPPLFQTSQLSEVCVSHLHTYTCLSYNSLISGWILIKFASVIVLCMFYLWTNFQPEASFWMHLREASTPFIDYSHNMHSRHIICKLGIQTTKMYKSSVKV